MGCAWGNSGATGTQKLQEQNVIDDSGTNKMFVSPQPEGLNRKGIWDILHTGPRREAIEHTEYKES